VAIVIDRRSFLIAGVGYCVALAGTVFGSEGGAFTVLALGVVLLPPRRLLGAHPRPPPARAAPAAPPPAPAA
jgi:hypothetical protein